MEMSTRKAPIRLQSQGAHVEGVDKTVHKTTHRNYTTRRRRIKVTFTQQFWDMAWIAIALTDAVLLYTLIQIARGVL